VSPEIAARLRVDAPVLLIGIVVFTIGIGSLLMHAPYLVQRSKRFRGRGTSRLLLWFSAFSMLYGARIIVGSAFASEVFRVQPGVELRLALGRQNSLQNEPGKDRGSPRDNSK
jgi:hypothetical protein